MTSPIRGGGVFYIAPLAQDPLPVMQALDDAGILTEAGKEYLRLLRKTDSNVWCSPSPADGWKPLGYTCE